MFKRDGIWWTCIRYRGKKIQRSLETDNKKLAESIESKLRTELIEGKYFDRHEGERKTFREMIDRFVKEHAPKVSLNMQKSYTTSAKHLLSFFGDSGLTAITPKTINDYKVSRRDQGKKPATINKELATLQFGSKTMGMGKGESLPEDTEGKGKQSKRPLVIGG